MQVNLAQPIPTAITHSDTKLSTDIAQIKQAQTPHAAEITLHQVSRKFGDRQVLREINLAIPAGQFVAIVGRSGCGKSTLLRLLAGLDQPSSGHINIETSAQQLPDVRIMFQESRLLPWQRVLPNVALGFKKSDHHKALAVLEQVGLADRALEWPSVLSGGQRQRVALARALVHQPGLLLLDEPLGALDALTRIEMHTLITSLWQQHRFTSVLVTHDVHEAVALADRVILIEDGSIAMDKMIDLPRPRNQTSATFTALEDHILQRVLQTKTLDTGTQFTDTYVAHQLRWAI